MNVDWELWIPLIIVYFIGVIMGIAAMSQACS